jgi:hypothetical protein
MGDFLGNIAAKSLNLAQVLQPKPVSLYEPAQMMGNFGFKHQSEIEPAQELSEPMVANTVTKHPVATPLLESPTRHNRHEKIPPVEFPSGHEMTKEPNSSKTSSSVTNPIPEFTVQHHQQMAASDSPQTSTGIPMIRPVIENVNIEKRVADESRQHPFQSATSPQPRITVPWGQKNEPITQPQAPTPTIQVTIGRIEVRATPAVSQPQRQRPAPQPMGLEEYLRQRNGGESR